MLLSICSPLHKTSLFVCVSPCVCFSPACKYDGLNYCIWTFNCLLFRLSWATESCLFSVIFNLLLFSPEVRFVSPLLQTYVSVAHYLILYVCLMCIYCTGYCSSIKNYTVTLKDLQLLYKQCTCKQCAWGLRQTSIIIAAWFTIESHQLEDRVWWFQEWSN